MSSSPETKVYVDWGKLFQITLLVVAVLVLALADKITSEATIGILSAGAGYIFGNGKSVREGHLTTAPLIGRKPLPLTDEQIASAETVVVRTPEG